MAERPCEEKLGIPTENAPVRQKSSNSETFHGERLARRVAQLCHHFFSFLFISISYDIILFLISYYISYDMTYDMKSDFHISLHNCIVFGLRVSEVLASSKHLGWWMGRQGVPTAAWHFESLWEVFPLCRRYVDRPWRLPHPHRLCGSGWP